MKPSSSLKSFRSTSLSTNLLSLYHLCLQKSEMFIFHLLIHCLKRPYSVRQFITAALSHLLILSICFTAIVMRFGHKAGATPSPVLHAVQFSSEPNFSSIIPIRMSTNLSSVVFSKTEPNLGNSTSTSQ